MSLPRHFGPSADCLAWLKQLEGRLLHHHERCASEGNLDAARDFGDQLTRCRHAVRVLDERVIAEAQARRGARGQ